MLASFAHIVVVLFFQREQYVTNGTADTFKSELFKLTTMRRIFELAINIGLAVKLVPDPLVTFIWEPTSFLVKKSP